MVSFVSCSIPSVSQSYLILGSCASAISLLPDVILSSDGGAQYKACLVRAPGLATPTMSAHTPNNIITNPDPPCAPGVTLSKHRKQLVGSVLDLFQAKPSLYKLSFWREDGVYEDPCVRQHPLPFPTSQPSYRFAKAEGVTEVGGQFYGLPELVRSSVSEHVSVIESSERTIRMDVVQLFTPKLLPDAAAVRFHTTMRIELDEHEKIRYLEDRPKDRIPENSLAMLFRKGNAVVTPKLLGIPQTPEEDLQRWKRWYGDGVP
jgi:hypothetical protein